MDLMLRHLARVWYHQAPLITTPDRIAQICGWLGDTFELRIAMRSDLAKGTTSAVQALVSPGGWQVTVNVDSIDIELAPPGDKEVSFEEFLARSSDVLSMVAASSPLPGHRMAAITEGFVKVMTVPEMDAVCGRLLYRPHSLQTPFEWDWRCAQRVQREFGGVSEDTNTIAIVRRTNGQRVTPKGMEAFDRIRIDLDVNTVPDNLLPRFQQAHVQAFFVQAKVWLGGLRDEVLALSKAGSP